MPQPRTIQQLKCIQCDHVWTPRGRTVPIRCPDCRRTTWNAAGGHTKKRTKKKATKRKAAKKATKRRRRSS